MNPSRIAAIALPLAAPVASDAHAQVAASARQVVIKAGIAAAHPHDRGAYTEGLLFKDGRLYESTGIEARSEIREVSIRDGRVLRRAAVPGGNFGEGLVDWGSEFLSVTWQTGVGYRWDAATFRLKSTFRYPGEGWGMTRAGRDVVMSDGTAQLRFLDPATFRERRRISVSFNGKPITQINELEWIDGEIWANVWTTDLIARIDPVTGEVRSWVDISSAAAREPSRDPNAVANGIAWDARRRVLYVTGKNWGSVYELNVPGTTGVRPARR